MNERKLTVDCLIDINSELRGLPREECDYRAKKNRIQAPPLVSPKRETQEQILAHLLDSLPRIENRRYRAAAAYYLLNLLHLFRDGNGRTSRAIFGLLAGLNNRDYSVKGISQEFENDNRLLDVKKYDELAMFVLLGLLSEGDDIYAKLQKRQRGILGDMNSIESSDFALVVLGGAFSFSVAKETLGAYDSFARLNDEDKTRVCCAMIDHNTGPVVVSGLAMLQFYSRKSQQDDFLRRIKRREGEWIININDGECAEWGADDFLDYAKIAEDIRQRLLELEVDIFKRPNDFMIDDKTVAEIATNPKLLNAII